MLKKESLLSLTILIDHYFNHRVFYTYSLQLLKSHKVDFLCLKKRVWFYREHLIVACFN